MEKVFARACKCKRKQKYKLKCINVASKLCQNRNEKRLENLCNQGPCARTLASCDHVINFVIRVECLSVQLGSQKRS